MKISDLIAAYNKNPYSLTRKNTIVGSSKKKNKKKIHTDKSNPFKQKKLKWFITERGKQVIPSPIEDKLRVILNGYNIQFYTEVSFIGLNPTNTKTGWLRYDIYIPSKKIAIEYQGKDYHLDPEVKKRDKLKVMFCKANGIRLKRYYAKDLPTIELQIHKLIL